MALLESEQLPKGWQAPEFTLKGTDNQVHSLSDFVSKKGVLIIFTCNHCPYAKAAWPLTTELYNQYHNEIDFVAISSNDVDEYPDDSFENMQKFVLENKIDFPYLFDETQKVAKQYKAQCTPDPYLFNIEETNAYLYYHGRINDNWQYPEKVKEENLKNSLQCLIDANKSPEYQPPSMGCSIKWK